MVYFDYSAHTLASQHVLDTFLACEKEYTGNANSHHGAGRKTEEKIQETTQEISALLHVQPQEIIYTSGATEANNLAVKGIAAASKHVGKHIVSTSLEHSSISASLSTLQAQGYEIDLVPLAKTGEIDLEELNDLIRDDTCLVSVSAVDSELGIRQPLKEISEIVKQYPDCRLHIDATQAIGKIPFDFSYGDTVSFSAHKFYGLTGIGALVKKENVSLVPQMSGGASTTVYRSGTPAAGLIVSLLPALQDALNDLDANYQKVQELNEYLQNEIRKMEHVQINSTALSIPHILNLSIPGLKGYESQKLLDERDIAVSVKSACSVDLLPSKAVLAVTGNKRRALESFRISLSPYTAKEECDTLLAAIEEISSGRSV